MKNQQRTFRADEIKKAHSKVKSGADFPTYIQDLKKLGVSHYETFVADGHTDYYGVNDYIIRSPAKYASLNIAQTSNKEEFQTQLKAHQEGKTDYPTFCNDASKSGIEKWVVLMEEMTCTYFDKANNSILVEEIPH
ncbi:DUF1398 domain-containing protein [Arenibacter algicola]|uniref:DUF1398 domain-containing protein n=1 Tax=Arenibacter algicola TaxID=616991 RepID=UPI001C070878|nr:DUF1398 family protein [Arenibacter algicola]MBU2906445.1 DUF1398 domain-containing protein [Arenibacter algicola]